MTGPVPYRVTGAPKPYIHPLRSPGGRLLTRAGSPRHPWHRGLWFAVKWVDGDNFWEEQPPYGVQRHDGDDPRAPVRWVRPDGTVALVEDRSVTAVDLGRTDAWAIDWVSSLTPGGDRAVLLDRTPYTTWGGYGGLTFRGAGDWAGTRLLIDGAGEHRRPEGIPGRWCDLSGADAGVTLLDHPANPRHPVTWYGATRSRIYGDDWANYCNAAFLFGAPWVLEPGTRLTLRYRVVIHDGPWDAARCDRAWEAFAGGSAEG